MKYILLLFALLISSLLSLYAQTTFVPAKDSINSVPGTPENDFSLNFKLTYYYEGYNYSSLGGTAEFQHNATRLTSFLISFIPLISLKNNNSSNSTGFIYNLSAGAKFYLVDVKAKPYISVNMGLYSDKTKHKYLTLYPAVGMDYELAPNVGLNLEAKLNIHVVGVFSNVAYMLSSGINYKF